MPTSNILDPPRKIDDRDVHLLIEIVDTATQNKSSDIKPIAALDSARQKVCDRQGVSRARDELLIRWCTLLARLQPGQTLKERLYEELEDRGVLIEEGEALSVHGASNADADTTHEQPFARSRHVSLETAAAQAERRSEYGATRARSETSLSQHIGDTEPISLGPQWPTPNGLSKRRFDLSMLANASPAYHRELPVVSEHATFLEHHTERSQNAPGSDSSWNPLSFSYLSKSQQLPEPAHYASNGAELEVLPAERGEEPNQKSWEEIDQREPVPLISLEKLWHMRKVRKVVRIMGHRLHMNKQIEQWAVQLDDDFLRDTYFKRLKERCAQVADLEERAYRAESVRLLLTAFSHWHECTRDALRDTALAKQHVLTLRCFKAWRDVTATNEAKVNAFARRAFFRRWRNRTALLRSQESKASERRDELLLQRTLPRWVLQYRESHHSHAKDLNLKRIALASLVDRFRAIQERHEDVLRLSCQRMFHTWSTRKTNLDQLAERAERSEAEHSLRDSFASWYQQHRYVPLERDISDRVDLRIVKSAFARWLDKFRWSERHSIAHQHGLLRMYWDTWNEELRLQSMAYRIDDRIKAECLYRWVLAERCSMFRRLRQERLLEHCTQKLAERSSERSQALGAALATFRASQRVRKQRNIVETWTTKTRSYQRDQDLAETIDRRRPMSLAFDLLRLQQQRIGMLERQYEPSFVLFYKGKQTLLTLAQSFKESRNRKRHEAYVAVKRAAKQRLCMRYLLKWRDDALGIRALNDAAVEEHNKKLEHLATGYFYQWKDSASALHQRYLEAGDERDALVIHQLLRNWAVKLETIQDDLQKALGYDQEHSRRAAYRCLRTLHFRIHFIQERQMKTYLEVRHWNQRDLARSLLRLWLERSLRQRGVSETDLPPTAKTRRFKNMLRNVQHVEAAGNMGARQDDPSAVTDQEVARVLEQATPAGSSLFPNTPSRRFGRSVMRTPARLTSSTLLQQARQTQEQQAQQQQPARLAAQDTPEMMAMAATYTEPAMPATDSRMRQGRAFRRSTVGIRRTLFAPIVERPPFP